MTQNLPYCGALVKAHDPDRFLLSMFAPVEAREALWALFSFNHEIAKTRDVVSEPQLGLIRLQWWRDEIAKIYSGADSEHEILKPLAAAIRAHDLPQSLFEDLIAARALDLEGPPATLDALLAYADATSTPLMDLAVRISGDDPAAAPVYPVALNYALMGILRAAPYAAARGVSLLPAQVDIRAIAGQFVGGLRPENSFLRAAQALAGVYHRHLVSCGFDVLSPRFRRPPACREMRLFFHYFAGV